MDYSNKIYPIDEIKKVIQDMASTYPAIEEIVLFGSYGRHEALKTSDIDLLITKPEESNQ